MDCSTHVNKRLACLVWLVALALLCANRPSAAASCISDAPPNAQPATGQTVPTEFCIAGASGQHYYLWTIPESFAGRPFTVKLQSLPGESSILMLQSLDQDPRKGPFNFTTLWQGKSSAANSTLATPSLMLKPGLYGIVAATAEPPGLFRLIVAADSTLAPSPASSPIAPTPSAAPPAAAIEPAAPISTQPASPPVLDRKAVAGAAETIIPWIIDAAGANTRWTVVLQTTAGSGPQLALMGPDGKDISLDAGGRDKAGILHYPELGLPAGAYKFRIQAKDGSPMSLRIFAGGARDATHVTSPSASPAAAFVFKPGAPLSGVLAEKGASADSHYIALVVDESWKDKRFDLVLRATPADRSDRLILAYISPQGDDLGSRSGSGKVRFSNFTLDPGKYLFRLSAAVADDLPYTLAVENVSQRAAGEEREPNDVASLANLIPPDGTISGESDGDGDIDYFRLHVTGPTQLWQVTCDCKGANLLAIQGGNGEDIIQVTDFPHDSAHISSVLLAAGDHLIRLRTTNAHYVLRVTPQSAAPVEAGGRPAALDAPLTVIDEIEPNDDPAAAMPLALNSSRGGVNDRTGDRDFYKFTLLGFTHIRLTLDDSGSAGRHAILGWGSDQRPIATVSTPASLGPSFWDGTLPAGDYYVMVKADAADNSIYRLRLESRDPFAARDDGPPAPIVEAHLVFDQAHIAAYAANVQSLKGQLQVVSKSAVPLDLTVTPYVTDERWRASAAASSMHLDAGAKVSMPITVKVAPQVMANHPVQVGFGLRNAAGGHVSALATIMADEATAEVNPTAAQTIPVALEGGLNVAWSALGGATRDGHPELIDGLVNAGGSVKLKSADAKAGLTVALAGNTPIRLSGFALVPAGAVPAGDRLRHFKLSVSMDGSQFAPVFTGQLSARTDTQYFVLQKPVDARFVRLDPIDSQDANAAMVSLAELVVIADPSSAPLGTSGLEISPLLRGGHIVWMDPTAGANIAAVNDSQGMLSNAATRSVPVGWSQSRKEPLSWVVGFLDDMPARIDSISWSYADDEGVNSSIPAVEVFGSTTSPRGPWTDFGSWQIASHGASAPFKPAGQPLVRYLRFVAAGTKYYGSADLPLHLSIREIPVSSSYHSVLALPIQAVIAPMIAADTNSAGERPLTVSTPVQGLARLGSRTDHWLMDIPAGTSGLMLSLTHSPAIGAVLSMKGPDGKAVSLEESSPSVDVRQYKAGPVAGKYLIEVSEPPRSLVLSWDTSGSVTDWIPAITAAVRSVAQDASPGREEINLVPFHDPTALPLLKSFSGDPATVFAALQSYDWKDVSSNAEVALIGASQALESRQGRRGIILLTDGETHSLMLTPDLWQAMDKSGAQIFTLSVPTTSTGEDAWKSRNLMTDWAAASGGFGEMIGDQGDVEAAFQRAAAAMRVGAPYTLSASVAAGSRAPGKLEVTLAPGKQAGHPAAPNQAIALLLDASGSMLQKIKGRQKIEIARNELDHLIRTVIPDGTPTTLRVYGQGGKGSCRSDLMMPLAALDRTKAEAVVATVKSTDGAKTATAASLHATAQDLSAATGSKRVILVTDGEENCGGDVEAEIAALRKSGFDVQLDIVGFAIDSPQVGKTFTRWAKLGGGEYFEAKDAATLDTAMSKALRPQFEVLDANSTVVANGDVGGPPLSIPAGLYTVRLRSDQTGTVQAVVKPNMTTDVVLPH